MNQGMSSPANLRLIAWLLVAASASAVQSFGMMMAGELVLQHWYDWGFFVATMVSGPAIAWRAFMDQTISIYK